MNHNISDRVGYLAKMAKPLQEKLRVAEYITHVAANVLDVGCADGTVTLALAEMFPDKQFLGIDLDPKFIELAQATAQKRNLTNVRFEVIYLRDLLTREEQFDAVIFISVLHEFYSYGEGISSVLKALADANELLRPGGDIIIRDMVLLGYSKHTTYQVDTLREKIIQSTHSTTLQDFENHYGVITSIYQLNHFLLKYMYRDNWERELTEEYVPVTVEQYERAFDLLDMELIIRDTGLLPYLRKKWQTDFGLSEHEIAPLLSTTLLVAQKNA